MMRVMTSSRSPASAAVLVLASMSVLLSVQLAEVMVQAIEAFFPEMPVVFQPIGGVLEGTRIARTGSPLRLAAAFDEAGALRHLEVLGDRGKAHRERLGQLGDGNLAADQARQDRASRRIGEGREGGAEAIRWHRAEPIG